MFHSWYDVSLFWSVTIPFPLACFCFVLFFLSCVCWEKNKCHLPVAFPPFWIWLMRASWCFSHLHFLYTVSGMWRPDLIQLLGFGKNTLSLIVGVSLVYLSCCSCLTISLLRLKICVFRCCLLDPHVTSAPSATPGGLGVDHYCLDPFWR